MKLNYPYVASGFSRKVKAAAAAVFVAGGLAAWPTAQEGAVVQPPAGDWPGHNRDLHSTRFSPLTDINASNVGTLAVKWSFDQQGLTEQTPIVVDGVMYLGLGSNSIRVNPTGNTRKPAAGSRGYFDNIKEAGPSGVTPTTSVVAQHPATGAQMWVATIPGATNAGNLVTAGDVVFQGGGTGDFYAFDAKTGRQLLKLPTEKRAVSASPLAYAAGGKEFVAVVAGTTVLALALP